MPGVLEGLAAVLEGLPAVLEGPVAVPEDPAVPEAMRVCCGELG
jgi:hypothetical protein